MNLDIYCSKSLDINHLYLSTMEIVGFKLLYTYYIASATGKVIVSIRNSYSGL